VAPNKHKEVPKVWHAEEQEGDVNAQVGGEGRVDAEFAEGSVSSFSLGVDYG